jgi:hypothetical protein
LGQRFAKLSAWYCGRVLTAMRFSFTHLCLLASVALGTFTFPLSVALSEPNAQASAPIDLYAYQSDVERQIEHAWTPPGVPFGGCTCTFTIANDGSAKAIKIKDSSGVDEYDESCLKAIGLSAPFSAVPQGASLVSVSAHFDIGSGEQNVNLDMTALPAVPNAQSASAVGNQAANNLSTPVATINPVDMTPYIAGAKSKIEQVWAPPTASAGLVSCAITIGPLGNLNAVNVIPSFGTTDFNQAASDAIAKCDPFDQLPQGVNTLSLMVTFEKSGQTKKVDAVQN